MDALKPFSIPFQGLKFGIHQFEFQIDSSFFSRFEDSSIKNAALNVQLDLDKRTNMLVLDFKSSGTVEAECDRCLETIDLPVSGEYQLMVKFSEVERENTDEVIYINPKNSHVELANYVYELAHLSLPIRKLKPECDEFPEDCEYNMLDFFEDEEELDEEDKNEASNPIWGELSKFNKK